MPRPPTCSIIYLPRPFTYSFHSHATPTYLPPYLLATPIHLLLSLPCHAHLLAPLFTCHAHSPTPFTPMPRPPTCSIIYLPRPFTYSFHSHATPTYLPPYLLATPIHLLLSLPCHAHLLAPLFTCHAHSPTPFTPMPRPPAQSFTCHAHLPRAPHIYILHIRICIHAHTFYLTITHALLIYVASEYTLPTSAIRCTVFTPWPWPLSTGQSHLAGFYWSFSNIYYLRVIP